MPRYRLRTLLILLAVGPMVLAGAWWFGVWAWFLPALDGTSNCGGNNAARAYVDEYALMMINFAEDNLNHEFLLTTASPQQRRELAGGPSGWGIGSSDILISTRPLRLDQFGNRTIVAVCNRPFTNVPQYQFHRAPPRYAVGFSDGTTALLSAREYAAIDRTSFIPVNEINTLTP